MHSLRKSHVPMEEPAQTTINRRRNRVPIHSSPSRFRFPKSLQTFIHNCHKWPNKSHKTFRLGLRPDLCRAPKVQTMFFLIIVSLPEPIWTLCKSPLVRTLQTFRDRPIPGPRKFDCILPAIPIQPVMASGAFPLQRIHIWVLR